MSAYYEKFTRWLLVGTRRFSADAVAKESSTGDPISAKAARVSRVDRRPRGRAPAPPLAASAFVARAQRARASRTEALMTHPGHILGSHLRELGLSASDLARDIDVPVNRVTGILNGQRGITADTALRLGHWFGVDPSDWLELQLQYELTQAEKAAGATIRKLPRLSDREDA